MLIRDLIQTISMDAPDAPEPVIVAGWVNAAREFCTRTSAWRTSDIRARRSNRTQLDGSARYFLIPPEDAEVFDARSVKLGDRKLDKVSAAAMLERGTKGYRVMQNTAYVAPDPGDDGPSLTGLWILRPTRIAEEIDDEFAGRFAEIIELGALAWVLRRPNKTWGDPRSGLQFYAQFQDHIDEWMARASDDGMTGVHRKTGYGGY